MNVKVKWQGKVLAVQPRIRLMRSLDQRSHNYLGYVLLLRRANCGEDREFTVAVGKGAHEKYQFRIGDYVSWSAVPVNDMRLETAEFYKASGLKTCERETVPDAASPPFLGIPRPLAVYRAQGHRHLLARMYTSQYKTCICVCEMAVEMIIDQWNPSVRRYRRQTFCYGPKSCSRYAAGPIRNVPGRKGTTWEEENWVDEEATERRREDD